MDKRDKTKKIDRQKRLSEKEEEQRFFQNTGNAGRDKPILRSLGAAAKEDKGVNVYEDKHDEIFAEPEDAGKQPGDLKPENINTEEKRETLEKAPVVPEDPEAIKNKEDGKNLRKEKIEELRKEIDNARKEYLEVDYEKNAALSRVRKYFSVNNIASKITGKGNLRASYEHNADPKAQDEDIAYLRAQYDNKRFDLKNLLIEEAKEKGASNEELANLYIEFRTEQRITLKEEHNKIKSEHLEGAIPYIGEKMVKFSKSYNDLPLKYKLAISGIFFTAGVVSGGIGGVAVSAFTAIAGGRRLASGMVGGVGTTLGLKALEQRRSDKQTEKEKQAFLKELEGLNEEKKYEKLTGKIENIAIKDKENSINRMKNLDIEQKAAGLAVGTFIGGGWMADYISRAWHGAAEHFSGGHGAGGVHQGLKPNASANHFDKNNIYAPDDASHAKGVAGVGHDDVTKLKEAARLNTAPKVESLTISKGGNFWAAIENKLNSVEPGVDNKDAVRLAWRDGVAEYARNHKISFDEAVAKLSKIRPGTEFSMVHDSNGWHAHFEDKNIKFMQGTGHHHVPKHGSLSPAAVVDNANVHNTGAVRPVSGTIPYIPEHDYGQDRISIKNEIERLNGEYRKALDEMGVDLKPEGVEHKLAIEDALKEAKEKLKNIDILEQAQHDARVHAINVSNIEHSNVNVNNEVAAAPHNPGDAVPVEKTNVNAEDLKTKSNAQEIRERLLKRRSGTFLENMQKHEELLKNTGGKTSALDIKKTGALAGVAGTVGAIKAFEKMGRNSLAGLLKREVSSIKFLRTSLEKITAGSPKDKRNAFWKEIKDKPFNVEALSKNVKIREKMLKTIEEFQGIIGVEASPKKDSNGKFEPVKDWLSRVTKKAFEKNKK